MSRYNTPELAAALRAIWAASDQLRSKCLKAWLPQYEAALQSLPGEAHTLLKSISAASIDHLLKPVRAEVKRKGLSGTKPGTLLKKRIPIQTGSRNVTKSCFMETDTVAHCGDSLAGNFVCVAGRKQTKIAAEIGVDKGTISRELKRNAGKRGWRPKQAQSLTVC